jgi:hypothetical protein
MGQEPTEKNCYLLTHHPSLMMQWYVPVHSCQPHSAEALNTTERIENSFATSFRKGKIWAVHLTHS